MKGLFSRLITTLLVLSLVFLSTILLIPNHAYGFGSLAENGTAAFMGIGTATPLRILHVTGTGPGTTPLFQRGVDSAGFVIERTPTNRWVLGANEAPYLGNGFVISTFPVGSGTSVPRLLITQEGKVGIGTITPSGQLHVVNDNITRGVAIYSESYNTGASVVAENHGDGAGVFATSDNGTAVLGTTPQGYAIGVKGQSLFNSGVYGESWFGIGIYGKGHDSDNSTAGYFEGRVNITKDLTVKGNVAVRTSSPPNSPLQVGGAIATAFRLITSDHDYVTAEDYITDNDSIVGIHNTGSPKHIYLPTAVGIAGRMYVLKKVDSSYGLVYLHCNGSETIDGQPTYEGLTNPWTSIIIFSDGANWMKAK